MLKEDFCCPLFPYYKTEKNQDILYHFFIAGMDWLSIEMGSRSLWRPQDFQHPTERNMGTRYRSLQQVSKQTICVFSFFLVYERNSRLCQQSFQIKFTVWTKFDICFTVWTNLKPIRPRLLGAPYAQKLLCKFGVSFTYFMTIFVI